MTVRAVEWKKPYTWGKAIDIDEDKVISLKLRAENNLIIYDEWDDEIYTDLQLDDEVRPTDDFPVWVTTGRAVVDNWWDVAWTVLISKTTSGDYFMILYGDDGKIYVDNWIWSLREMAFKDEVAVTVSDTAPSNPVEGKLWYDTVNYEFNLYDGTGWIVLSQAQPPV